MSLYLESTISQYANTTSVLLDILGVDTPWDYSFLEFPIYVLLGRLLQFAIWAVMARPVEHDFWSAFYRLFTHPHLPFALNPMLTWYILTAYLSSYWEWIAMSCYVANYLHPTLNCMYRGIPVLTDQCLVQIALDPSPLDVGLWTFFAYVIQPLIVYVMIYKLEFTKRDDINTSYWVYFTTHPVRQRE